jgi:putative redox protein
MVETEITYLGDLHCQARHGPSGMTMWTDAPVDNQGKGESFSPTDLVGVAMGTCMLTIMGIVARRHDIDLSGTTARVTKEMAQAPVRRIARLAVHFRIPRDLPPDDRQRLEKAALTCPVHQSLHPDVDAPVTFEFRVGGG